jgi:hypothetical protein
VRRPKPVVKKGKTPVPDGDEAKKLLDSIDVSTILGLRDRALIALLICTFARVSASLKINVDDSYGQGKRWRVRLPEKAASGTRRAGATICSNIFGPCLTSLRQAEGGELDEASPLFRTLSGRGRKQAHVSADGAAGRAGE